MPDRRAEALTSTVRAVHEIFRAVDTTSRRLLKVYGVTGPQLWALRTVHEARGLTVGALADRIFLHISTVSGILDRLEKGGWVERRRAVDDRRVIRLVVTRKGRALIARAPEPPRSIVLRGLKSLADRELGEMARSMKLLQRLMHGAAPAGGRA